jgi:hypothetical protein
LRLEVHRQQVGGNMLQHGALEQRALGKALHRGEGSGRRSSRYIRSDSRPLPTACALLFMSCWMDAKHR